MKTEYFGESFIFINPTNIYQLMTDTNIGARYRIKLYKLYFHELSTLQEGN